MLTPKFASDGFYVDNDKLDFLTQLNNFVEKRHPGLRDQAESEAVAFMTQMASLEGSRRTSIHNMSAKNYWKLFGKTLFPTLNLCADVVNEMICSSASSERAWSIYRFIHSRLRNRLSNEKVEKPAFIHINDKTNYILEDGVALSDLDCQEI